MSRRLKRTQDPSQEEYPQRITGAFIPGEVFFNLDLNSNDKFIWWLIHSLDGENHCWASNEFLSKRVGIGIKAVDRSIMRLRNLGYVEKVSFDGRTRILKINPDYTKTYKYLIDAYNSGTSLSKIQGLENQDPVSWESRPDINKKIENNDNLSSNEDKSKPTVSKHLKERKKQDDDYLDYNKTVRELFDFWNSLKITVHSKPSKIRNEGLYQLNIHARKYPSNKIKQSMLKYKELLDDPMSILHEKQSFFKVSLKEFFKFNTITKEKILTNSLYIPIRSMESWFKECLKDDDELIHLMMFKKDQHPKMTEQLKKVYSQEIKKLTKKDLRKYEGHFRNAASFLMSFHQEYHKFLTFAHKEKPLGLSFLYIDFIKSDNTNGIHPGWLCADWKQEQFPEWLDKTQYWRRFY